MPRPLRQLYQLKVSLEGSEPLIWRRLLVPDSYILGDLHFVLQIAMGWENAHLHEFRRNKACWSEADPDSPGPCQDEDDVRLGEILRKPRELLRYIYDFGDDWNHKVVLEKILPFDPKDSRPRCLDGARASPPEDCGGVWGYQRMLEVLADPEHPEYADTVDWYGDEIDPERFDCEETNRVLFESFRP